MSTTIPFGPNGQVVYERTYSRKQADGTQEIWPESVRRVARGNLELVYGPMAGWSQDVLDEFAELCDYMTDFRIIPAGRHLWASGVKGRQYLFNCHVAGWGEKLSRHFEFTFMRLMEGGGVGANYSSQFLRGYGLPRRKLNVHVVCDPNHADYQAMLDAGVLSAEYDSDWTGSFEVEDSREGWSDAMVDLIDTFMTDDTVRNANRVYDVSRVRPEGSRLKTFGGSASGPRPFAVMLIEIARVLSNAVLPAGVKADGRSVTFDFREGNRETRLFFPNAEVNWLDDKTYELSPKPFPRALHLSPVEAAEIDHAIAECVVSGGVRRSARMAQVRWDDEFIEDFLDMKIDGGKHWTTNVSVIIDDEFCRLLAEDDERAWLIHERVVEGMLTNGEPGYWHIDNSNVGEPNPVIATNPCGEIALQEWENCNLGHINLDAFATADGDQTIGRAHELMTRFLMRATFGDVNDAEQGATLARNRRIGVGHLGVQGFLAKAGVRYTDAIHSEFPDILTELYQEVRKAAVEYAHELRIPVPVKLTTVAPTGSIAKLPGVTEGLHPIYAAYFDQRIRFSMTDPAQRATVDAARDAGLTVELDSYDASGNTMIVVYPTKHKLLDEVEALGHDASIVQSADEITVTEHLAFQQMYQQCWADNAVSFTVNVPAEPHQNDALLAGALTPPPPSIGRVEEVAHDLAVFLPNLKGTTIMLDGSRVQAPYTRITREEFELSQAAVVGDGIDENCANGACPVR